jgi:hypothetical protein
MADGDEVGGGDALIVAGDGEFPSFIAPLRRPGL